jgi:predicted NodU family carbamoyl transferase
MRGGALGAAYLAHLEFGQPLPRQELRHAYWGPSFTGDEIIEQLDIVKVPYEKPPESQIPECVSRLLLDRKIAGWFRLGSEWGPRALGARSIVADPRPEEIRDRVNLAVKYRDRWRPFARHMREIAGVTHPDGTTRPQMVVRDANPCYYDAIQEFGKRAGVPMALNTSFNLKGEPMVNTPRDALRTFSAAAWTR